MMIQHPPVARSSARLHPCLPPLSSHVYRQSLQPAEKLAWQQVLYQSATGAPDPREKKLRKMKLWEMKLREMKLWKMKLVEDETVGDETCGR